MEAIFNGKWDIEVIQKDAENLERFRIIGADVGSGIYPGILGMPLTVDGAEWKIILEWNDGNGSGWHKSELKKVSSFLPDKGFVFILSSDDGFSANQDFDFNDLVLLCRCMDPELNPELKPNPYDFTVPKKHINQRDHR